MADISNFLSKQAEDRRPPGTALTWRDVFNETDQAIMSISRFMEVSGAKKSSWTRTRTMEVLIIAAR